MSLPEITVPAGTPVFLETGHAQTPRSVFANVEMRTGYARKRRLGTYAPRIQAVSWFLSRAQMVAVDDWFENTLLAGNRTFSVQVANLGAGLLWWEAQWVAPYEAEPLHSGFWRVRGELLLIGAGSVAGPVSTSAGVEIVAALNGTAAALGDGHIALEVSAALLPVSLARLEITVALLHVTPEFMLHEDGGYLLREDGSRIQRE